MSRNAGWQDSMHFMNKQSQLTSNLTELCKFWWVFSKEIPSVTGLVLTGALHDINLKKRNKLYMSIKPTTLTRYNWKCY